MPKIVLYYHIYLTDDVAAWSSIFLEQLKCMEDSQLLSNLDTMKITAIAPDDSRRNKFFNLCQTYSVNGELEWITNPHKNDHFNMTELENNNIITENHTYRKIYNDCLTNDQIVAYIHSKGVTSYMRYLDIGNNDSVETFKRYYYWRQYLNWGAIENWKTMIQALETYDAAGVNLQQTPVPHFSGSFWWSKSEWIRKLPNPATNNWWIKFKNSVKDPWIKSATDRFKDEQWLTHNTEVKIYNIAETGINPAFTLLTKNGYVLPLDQR